MNNTTLSIVKIAPEINTKTMSKHQKRFNTLIQKIEKKRLTLSIWKEGMHLIHEKKSLEEQMLETLKDIKFKMAIRLDEIASVTKLSKKNKKITAEFIIDLLCEIMASQHAKTDAFKALYNKYGDFDQDKSEAISCLAFQMKYEFNVDTNDIDIESLQSASFQEINDFFMKKRNESIQNMRPNIEENIRIPAQEKPEIDNASKSVREIFRKLSSLLHPDKEQDLNEKARKTELLQRVNIAYKAGDLLQLLSLQMEVEQIDQNAINELSEEKLTHYNQVLKNQLNELESEIEMLQYVAELKSNLNLTTKATPKSVLKKLDLLINNINSEINIMEKKIEYLSNPVLFKQILQLYVREIQFY